ncbi:hypothetical protein L7F22_003582 [Adiantum nelumboides]|nr:hypothetical protein [Adiantum nelumboides]
MFAACRELQEANSVFNRLASPNLFAWNEIILAQIELGCAEEGLELYRRMQWSNVIPDAHIHVTVLRACASKQVLTPGKLIHCNVVAIHTEEPGLFIWSALIDMYSKCGSMQDAQSIFNKLRICSVVLWSAMIAGYVNCGKGEEALHLYQRMLFEGFDPDVVTVVSTLKACSNTGALREGKLIHAQIVDCGFSIDATLGNTLLNMYARCASHAEVQVVFKILRKRDMATWSSIVDSYLEHKDHALALCFFESMLKDGVKPDEVALLCLLSVCSQLGLVENGCHHFNTLAGSFGLLPRLDHVNCMVDLFGRAGCLIEAKDLLKTTPYHDNAVGWRCLLSRTKSYSEEGVNAMPVSLDCTMKLQHVSASAAVMQRRISNNY